MANIIEIANSAYEERDRAQEKLAMLISQAEREKTEYDKEVAQMTNLIEKISVRNQFIKSIDNQHPHPELPTQMDSEDITKKKSQTNNWVKKDPSSSERLDSFREAFSKIEAATGISDIEVLVTNFIKAEEKNFALFKFVNEVANDIEAIEADIEQLQQELESGM